MSDIEGDPDRPITIDYVLELLASSLKLRRERGVMKLDKLLKSWETPPDDDTREANVLKKLRLQSVVLEGLVSEKEECLGSRPSSSSGFEEQIAVSSRPVSRSNSIVEEHLPWEFKHGYLMACYPLISYSKAETDDKEFLLKVRDIAITLLRHPRIQVQMAAGGVLGFMSKYAGPSVFEASRQVILDLVTENLNAVCIISEEDELISVEQGFDVNLPSVVIRQKVIKESLGWNNLEPSLKCLQFMIENLESSFVPFMQPTIINLTFKCLSHPIRHVRETGFQICNALIIAAPEDMKEVAHQLSRHLANGLSDNWNQVRMASAIATRTFFLKFLQNKEEFYPVLLPKLCLNRYYKADGIRLHIQDSWKKIVGSEGRQLVAKYMKNIVDCYLESTNSSNLAEREAACACISELATKIDSSAFQPFGIPLLEALIVSAKNESWCVRDAACLAAGNFVLNYPQESRPFLPGLYEILFKNLEDPIQLLHQGAATALGNIAEAYGREALDVILHKLTAGLKGIDQNPAPEYPISPSNPPDPGQNVEGQGHVVHDLDACAQHEPQCEFAVPGKVLVSSESLMRALGQDNLPSPCLSCRRSKIPQPWHLTDGCLYLIGGLSTLPEFKNDLEDLVPLILKTTEIRNYSEHWTLLQTFCKILPLVAKAIGKRPFKESLNAALEPIFYTVESLNPMISESGLDCLRQLAQFLGPNILRSRVELYDPKFVSLIPN